MEALYLKNLNTMLNYHLAKKEKKQISKKEKNAKTIKKYIKM